ncbi:MAG: hypothetical protein KGL78_00815 [Burkholderiales bacterium]|nr:hypothetical protein [Burkholderiales bacterium]
MLDEFQDAAVAAQSDPSPDPPKRRSNPIPRLVARMYAASDAALRARVLQRLLDPLGTLGMAAVAAGAFAIFVQRRGIDGIRVSLDDVSRFSGEQIAELAHFVWQVSPEALQSVANAIVDSPVGLTAFSASAAVLLVQALGRMRPGAVGPAGVQRDSRFTPSSGQA